MGDATNNLIYVGGFLKGEALVTCLSCWSLNKYIGRQIGNQSFGVPHAHFFFGGVKIYEEV